jgi:predicted transcriptional regulator
MRRSGALKGQRFVALELVKQFPGRSSKELAKLGTLDRYQLARRLPELVTLGHVRVTQTGNDDQKWWEVG